MERTMNGFDPAGALLRLRLILARLGPLVVGAVLLCVAGALALLWLVPERALQAQRQVVAMGVAGLPPPVVTSAPQLANANLALFYDNLGEQRHVEQQVKLLFGLAAKSGLTLSQGEYKAGADQNGRFATYQMVFPVRGSYRAIWQFCLLALEAIPFASLDDISFRRDSIGEPVLEARLRMTLYLATAPGTPGQGAAR
jgi:hypothetical protein